MDDEQLRARIREILLELSRLEKPGNQPRLAPVLTNTGGQQMIGARLTPWQLAVSYYGDPEIARRHYNEQMETFAFVPGDRLPNDRPGITLAEAKRRDAKKAAKKKPAKRSNRKKSEWQKAVAYWGGPKEAAKHYNKADKTWTK